ncbi:MAG TPA: FliI/YscN family ATPase [Caulobacteraceae bacterium]|jgi:flagellum-specific ATP synthase
MTDLLDRIRSANTVVRSGRVRRILPTYIEADGPAVPLGTLCDIERRQDMANASRTATAKVVGVHADSIILAPFEDASAVFAGAKVEASMRMDAAPVGDVLSGRAVDALGDPIDALGPLKGARYAALEGPLPSPLARMSPQIPLRTGIRTIDGLLTLGMGQRIGIFAAAGVGKTTLMTQLANQVEADRCVVCLVGERGREVQALWEGGIAPAVRARTTLIAATSDHTAAVRVRAGEYALAVAEHWRERGEHVLLLVDSVTRLAMALREIGLAAGEPPTVRAYTPSVFGALPRFVERCGALRSGGAITAIMTILSETDDVDDPISEMMKSLLDGHLILSRTLAEQGHYPAIDVPRSVSRLARNLMAPKHREDAAAAAELLSIYETSKTLVEAGVYVRGANPDIDRALNARPRLLQFLKQGSDASVPLDACVSQLAETVR